MNDEQIVRLTYNLNSLQVYTLLGLPGQIPVVADCLFPTPLSRYDPNPAPQSPQQQSRKEDIDTPKDDSGTEVSLRPMSTPPTPSGAGSGMPGRGKGKRKRPPRGRGRSGRGGGRGRGFDDRDSPLSPAADGAMMPDLGGVFSDVNDITSTLNSPVWSIATSSESEYSDTEGGRTSRVQSFQARVRLAALLCLHAVIKVCVYLHMYMGRCDHVNVNTN